MELILQVLALEPAVQVLSKEHFVPIAILLVVILVVPILFERLRLPGLVGLLLAGLVLGPNGFSILHKDSALINSLSDIGLVYLIFVASLQVDIQQFRRVKSRSLGFGFFTFIVPVIVGTAIGRIFNFDWNASILIGSLLASHTLVAYPKLARLGVVNNEAVAVTVGATIVTDLAALLVLAGCLVIHRTEDFNYSLFVGLISSLIVYSIVVVVGFDWLGKEFFRRSGDEEGHQFLFVMLSVFVTFIGAQIIGVNKIVAAFLAGLGVNEILGEGPVKDKVLFVGNVLFIPIFFVNLGLQIDLLSLANLQNLWLTVLIVVGLIISKFIAAFLAKVTYRYTWQEAITMWSLSIPQVGTTLAAALVGYEAKLLNIQTLNSIIVLMLLTSILGPLITSRSAVGLTSPLCKEQKAMVPHQKSEERNDRYTIIVPVYNPQTQQHLIEMAGLLARQTHGKIVPLAIATAFAHMDSPQLEASVQRSQRLLAKATALSKVLGVEAQPLMRIDDAFAQGISRASREQKASLIVMGWGKRTGLKARLFGNVIDNVLWSSHCPVAVTRLVDSPSKIQRILVPLENLTPPSLQSVQFAQTLAEANQAQVTLLNVCERRTSSNKIAWRRSQLSLAISKLGTPNPPEIQILAHENTAQAILQAARLFDLVVLPFVRNRTSPDRLAISDVTTQLANQLTCSIVVLGEPQRIQTAVVPADVPAATAAMSEGVV
ncbi:cation:proton antiporter [Scytonema sp. NUACC26]|uniref:cation:proton antiporter domain-containing protein n=1 Tax=Scytonema sp. NUACC26 TaxID=3140176 RepID=UPI0034DCB022